MKFYFLYTFLATGYIYIFGQPTTGRAIESKHGSDHGANAHTDYGMVTLLSTDGTPGLQVCTHNSSALLSLSF